MSQWNDLSRDRLIKEYRKYPCLWSNKDEDVKNAEKRRECLALITAELNKYEQQKTFTQDEVRTQFKNLRDMYRRKRKKLQLQLDTNVSVDEPGWVYFQRLKFLDDSIEFSLPSDSAHLPPPKKKGKTAANRSADDASLPTPLEENSNGSSSSPGGLFQCPTAEHHAKEEQKQQQTMVVEVAEEMVKHEEEEVAEDERQDEERHGTTEGRSSGGGAQMAEPTPAEGQTDEREDSTAGGGATNGARENVEMPTGSTASSSSFASSPAAASPPFSSPSLLRGAVAEICSQIPLNPSALFPVPSQLSTSAARDNSAPIVPQQQQRRAETEEEDAEEFACFGRFVAMTLRKISALSPIDALEARKEISDVLYFYQKRSLSK
ncbi:hypothetical protein niasHS_007178 [Heterodera schachtii]|uniref:MADF domain-containing protein n=1 Tax=Heterodera schachtii TaxID=97005 RepID=A0ABD2JL86_HETSC